MNYRIVRPDELYHYGVRGMRWGHRKAVPSAAGTARRAQNMTPEQQSAIRKQRAKKAAVIGATVAVAAVGTYGAYKVSKIRSKNTTAVETWILKNGGSSLSKYKDGTVVNRTVKRSKTLLGPRLDIVTDTFNRNMYAPSSREVKQIGSNARAIRRSSKYIF